MIDKLPDHMHNTDPRVIEKVNKLVDAVNHHDKWLDVITKDITDANHRMGIDEKNLTDHYNNRHNNAPEEKKHYYMFAYCPKCGHCGTVETT